MGAKKWIGVALMVWGGVGVLNQSFGIMALQGSTAPTAALNSFDPASVFSISNPQGAQWTSPAMITDASIAALGAYLYFGKL